jgi:hypothetical protein
VLAIQREMRILARFRTPVRALNHAKRKQVKTLVAHCWLCYIALRLFGRAANPPGQTLNPENRFVFNGLPDEATA